jgi:hypothetical protein
MKKLTEEEFSKEISNTLLQIDKEIKLRKEELLSLPTKEDRTKKVKKITKMVLNRRG